MEMCDSVSLPSFPEVRRELWVTQPQGTLSGPILVMACWMLDLAGHFLCVGKEGRGFVHLHLSAKANSSFKGAI